MDIQKMNLEPKIYSLLVKTPRGNVIHLGIYFTLEDAFSAARVKIEGIDPLKEGENIDLDLWTSLTAREVMAGLSDPSKADGIATMPFTGITSTSKKLTQNELPEFIDFLISEIGLPRKEDSSTTLTEKEVTEKLSLKEHVEDMYCSKNNLMKKLISEGDIDKVAKLKSLLGSYSTKYVLSKIEKKKDVQVQQDI